ncbi:MAG: YcxB family protein [Planctomycetota bacterium]|nr:MAG: YcxB family protein [Planctomycetota bacterium]
MKYKLTKKDYYRAYLLSIKARKAYSILGILLVCLGLLVCLWSILPGDPDYKVAGIIFLSIIVCLSAIYIFPVYNINKSFKQTKGIDDDIDLTVNEESFSLSGKNFNINFPYEDIFKIKSDDNYLLVYDNQYAFRVIPKRDNDLRSATKIIEDKYKILNTSKNKK